MFNSFAALSNSASIGDAKSTFTRWIDPADGSVLLWHSSTLVKVVGMLKYLLRLLKADPTLGVRP